MPYHVLAIDIDGTLVNSRDEIPAATSAALARAIRAGIRVVLATGRRYSHTLHLVERLGLRVPLVTASGGLVKDPADHRTLYRSRFDDGLLRQVLAIVDGCGRDALLFCDTYTQGFDYYQARAEARSPELAEYLSLNAGCGRIWPGMSASPPPDVLGGFAMGSRQDMLDLERELHARLPDRLTTHVLHPLRYRGFICELAPAGVTKWSAICRLAADWGIGPEAICAVGDDVNDVAMIRAAGLGVAMGNAPPAALAAARRIAPALEHDGLVEVVRWLLEEAL
jgi:hypothetical protein